MKPASEHSEVRAQLYMAILTGVILCAWYWFPGVSPEWVVIAFFQVVILTRPKSAESWHHTKPSDSWYRVGCQRVVAFIATIPPKQRILFLCLILVLGSAWFLQWIHFLAFLAGCILLLPMLYPKLSDPFSPCAVCDAAVRWPHFRWRKHGKFIIVCTDCQRQLLGEGRQPHQPD